MPSNHRPRQLVSAVVSVGLVLALAACAQDYPNSTFNPQTEFNRAILALWDQLLRWGTIVFIVVEAALIYTIIKFRRREGQPEPKHVHGNTTLEIMWTVAPAIILVLIAVPTVRTIFRTQAKAVPDALQVEVIGHQWWWEFYYPEYGIRTANELYVPIGRTVNFALKTEDVLHSFWVPQMGGKRDLIANHTNYLWFTPDSVGHVAQVWNGFCTEYCGASHANMKFRLYTVQPDQFDRWVAHQASPAMFGAVAPPAPVAPTAPAGAAGAAGAAGGSTGAALQLATAPGAQDSTALTLRPPVEPYWFPAEELPPFAIPTQEIPRGLRVNEALVGDAERGREIYSRSSCIGCHAINGNPSSVGRLGPDLTHFGSRHTLAAGMYANTPRNLTAWIKNARLMKPGSLMPTLGADQIDPITAQGPIGGGLTEQQVADIVAYLLALK